MLSRIECLAAVSKLVWQLEPGEVRTALDGSPLVCYLAGYLDSDHPPLVAMALVLAYLLLQRLPGLVRVRGRHAEAGGVADRDADDRGWGWGGVACVNALILKGADG